MAAPSITKFERNGLPSNTHVNYELTYSPGTSSSGVTPNANNYGNTYYSNVSISVVCSGNPTNPTSSTITCMHGARGKNALQTAKATLSYSYQSVDREWNSGYWGEWITYATSSAQEKPTVPDDTTTVKYRVIGSAGNWEKQRKRYHSGYYDYYWDGPYTGSTSKEFTFYAPPEEFTFINCFTGRSWLVSSGLNSLITNLKDFQAVAKKWKQWKNQSSQSNCPSFDSPLSHGTMNNIYTYMDLTGNFSSGDKVSAKMFNDLATQLNKR